MTGFPWNCCGHLVLQMILFFSKPSPSLANVLRRTLRQLESSHHTHGDASALRALKSSILQKLAEIEMRKADGDSDSKVDAA